MRDDRCCQRLLVAERSYLRRRLRMGDGDGRRCRSGVGHGWMISYDGDRVMMGDAGWLWAVLAGEGMMD